MQHSAPLTSQRVGLDRSALKVQHLRTLSQLEQQSLYTEDSSLVERWVNKEHRHTLSSLSLTPLWLSSWEEHDSEVRSSGSDLSLSLPVCNTSDNDHFQAEGSCVL